MNRSEILKQAEEMVCGHREQDYGTPENNFDIIAKLWTAYSGYDFSGVDVAMMMALLKIARIKSGTMTEDSFVDGCGYLACGGEIATNKLGYGGFMETVTNFVKATNNTTKAIETMKDAVNEEIKPGGSENESE